MKTICLIGGMSWESTQLYYQIINRAVAQRLGGLHSARILLHSLDFDEVVQGQRAGDWDGLAQRLRASAQGLAAAGAELLLICTNTMHRVASQLAGPGLPPLLHIADVTGQAIRARGLRRVALLGTRFTMEQPFYREHLARMDIDCVVPPPAQRDEVHRIIFDELCRGQILPGSRQTLQAIAAQAVAEGAEGVVLGCTELPLILDAGDLPVPVFDTTALHAQAAVDLALAGAP